MTTPSDAEPTTEDQVAGGGAMAEAASASSASAPEVQPSQDGVRAAPSAAGSQPSTAIGEEDGGRRRPRIVVYARPPESWAEQSGRSLEPELKAEQSGEYTRLEAADFYYRGTPDGAFRLANLFKFSFLQDGEEETPQRKQQIEFFRPQYLEAARDLAHFNQLTRIESIANVAAIDQSSGTPKQRETGFEQPSESAGLARDIFGIPDGRFSLFSSSDPVREWNARKAVLRGNPDLSRMAVAGFGRRSRNDRGPGDEVAKAAAKIALAQAIQKLIEKSRELFWPAETPLIPEKDTQQRSTNTQGWENRAITGDPRVDRTVDELLTQLDNNRPAEFLEGPEFGTDMHLDFAVYGNNLDRSKIAEGLGRPDMSNIEFVVEQNYHFGEKIKNNPKDTVRPDHVIIIREKGKEVPLAIIDLKTNTSRFSESRVRQLVEGVDAPPNVIVIEIRMTGKTLIAKRRR